MAVLAYRRRCKSIDIVRIDMLEHLLKTDRRDMVTFINYHHAIVLHERFDVVIVQT